MVQINTAEFFQPKLYYALGSFASNIGDGKTWAFIAGNEKQVIESMKRNFAQVIEPFIVDHSLPPLYYEEQDYMPTEAWK